MKRHSDDATDVHVNCRWRMTVCFVQSLVYVRPTPTYSWRPATEISVTKEMKSAKRVRCTSLCPPVYTRDSLRYSFIVRFWRFGRINYKLCGIKDSYSLHDIRIKLYIDYRVFALSSKRPALHLLEVCWTFAGSCKHPITVLAITSLNCRTRLKKTHLREAIKFLKRPPRMVLQLANTT